MLDAYKRRRSFDPVLQLSSQRLTMRSLSLAIIAVSISFSVAASESGISIPLASRKRFTGQNGVANIPLLQKHVSKSLDKVSRGLDAFERNTGAKHPLDTGNRPTKRATGADPLTDDDDGSLWQGAISVGSPAKGFTGGYYHARGTLSTDDDFSGFRHWQ